MTNQEAADELQYAIDLIKQDGKDWLDERDIPILETAISALQAQEAKTQLSSAEVTTSGVKKTCITCKHYPPESKWPCIDCDMRNPADRWEPQELSKNSPKTLQNSTREMETCNELVKDTNVPCKDTISRQAVIEALDEIESEVADGDGFRYEKWRQYFCELPSAQPERKKGKWIPQDFNKHSGMESTLVYYYPKCSVCGKSANYTNFCPNCGADLRGDDDDQSK